MMNNNNNNALCDSCHKSVEPDGYNERLYYVSE